MLNYAIVHFIVANLSIKNIKMKFTFFYGIIYKTATICCNLITVFKVYHQQFY